MRPASRSLIERFLQTAGIAINGTAPSDIHVHDQRFYGRVMRGGSLALGESYMDGWWDVDALDVFFDRLLSRPLPAWALVCWPSLMMQGLGRLTNFPRWRCRHIGRAHYDIGNDLYQAMLGPTMVYSCGYWQGSRTLEEAQEAKMDLVCRKIDLRPGMRVLDIGCGWGSFARHAAGHYGAVVTGITVSREQERFARAACRGLPVEIRYQDYREVRERFDRIVSIGMFEHVGYKNYRAYMQTTRRVLADDGLALLHTIGSLATTTGADPWINRYIFPDAKIPSLAQISRACEGVFVVEDMENFGGDYDRTLMAWYRNVDAHRSRLRARYDERFMRLWRYYLLMCAGLFRSRNNQVWQLVLSPRGVRGGYPRAPVQGPAEHFLQNMMHGV